MKKIKLCGLKAKGKYALVDDEDFEWLNQWKWRLNYYGYVIREKCKNCNHQKRKCTNKKVFWMHREIINTPKGMYTDHINRIKSDNRRCNLRICTTSQNMANINKFSKNKSGFKGVQWDKTTKKWISGIGYNSKQIHLGRFLNKTEAAKAYNLKAKELFGKFAYLNKL